MGQGTRFRGNRNLFTWLLLETQTGKVSIGKKKNPVDQAKSEKGFTFLTPTCRDIILLYVQLK